MKARPTLPSRIFQIAALGVLASTLTCRPSHTEPDASPQSAAVETAPLDPLSFGSTGDGPTSLGPRTFVHPGIPLTTEDLDEVKRNLGREPWKTAFEALKTSKQECKVMLHPV